MKKREKEKEKIKKVLSEKMGANVTINEEIEALVAEKKANTEAEMKRRKEIEKIHREKSVKSVNYV